MYDWDGNMYSTYRNFIYSSDIFEVLEWAEAIKEGDLETFIRTYEPFDEDERMFDPIELAIAYDVEEIYEYLLATYDYTDFKNAVDFSLLVVLLVFEREDYLLTALETFDFSNDHLLEMYTYMIDHHDGEYFRQFYRDYPLEPAYRVELLRIALANYEVFMYLIGRKEFRPLLKDKDVLYDILSYHPSLLHLLEDVKDLTDLVNTDLFHNILHLEHEEDFQKVLAFLLKRGWTINMQNDFGLSLFHMALRFAHTPRYVEILVEKGAKTKKKTAAGFPPAHQLLFRDAQFTLDLSTHIDFNAKDRHGLTLQDYDDMQRKKELRHEDIIGVVRLALNMDEDYFYELSEEEFYNLSYLFDIEVFTPYLTLIRVEDRGTRDLLQEELRAKDIEVYDIMTLKEMFPETIKHDTHRTLQLSVDFYDLDAHLLEDFRSFAKENGTTIVIETEDYALNKMAHIKYTFTRDGEIEKQAIVHTHLVDVYYLHFYYDIPWENITYDPVIKRSQRFLN